MLENSIPTTQLFSYKWKCVNMDSTPAVNEETVSGSFPIDRQVFVKLTEDSCSKQWKVDTVTKEQKRLSVEVDGLPGHVADVGLALGVATEEKNTDGLSVSEDAQ